MTTITRRGLFHAALAGGAFLAAGRLPAWARSAREGNLGVSVLTGTRFDLAIDRFPVRIGGRRGEAVGVNGSLPAPLIRFREGEEVTIDVANRLDEDTSIHWHGLLVPFQMDGVPGVTFPGIRPGETFRYRFAVPQNGTYWYHSHSGLQEPLGHYGPLIVDPRDGAEPDAEREYVVVLSDWSFEDPHRIFSKLKKMSDTYNFQQRTVPDFVRAARKMGVRGAMRDRAMWGAMRMSPRDISDVAGSTYTYLINGHATADGWNAKYDPGDRVRLRIINASSMTIFNVRIPGLPMSVVQADGQNVRPVETDEFQIGVAETYDVIVSPRGAGPYALVAESIDRSGQVVATLAVDPEARAEEPPMRRVPTLGMRDMGMSHGVRGRQGAGRGSTGRGDADRHMMDHDGMDHGAMGHDGMDSGGTAVRGGRGRVGMTSPGRAPPQRGPGVANIAESPQERIDEAGTGLEDMRHRTLRYSELRSLDPNPDTREPGREVEVHLTGNMERYMWSFDGVKFSEVVEPIILHEGERVRLSMVNNTMMSHPIHLHGMFFELVNGGGDHKPRKHTVIVKPGERLSVDVTADSVGDWAFHCHLIFHMHAGMMQVVSVLPERAETSRGPRDGNGARAGGGGQG